LAYDRTLVRIRERSLLELLDLALVVLRARPVTLVKAALFGIVPFAVFNYAMFGRPYQPGRDQGPGLLLNLLEAPLATAPLTIALGALMFGQKPTAWKTIKTLVRSLPSLLIYQVILRNILLFTILFSPLLPFRLAFLNEVILLERGRWWKVVRRSSDLCGGRGGELFIMTMLEVVYGFVFVMLFAVGALSIYRVLVGEDPTWEIPEGAELDGARYQVATWMVICLFSIARFLVYIDQRIRLEGWEVELRLRSVARSLEESDRW
jgi:hypothetical protein